MDLDGLPSHIPGRREAILGGCGQKRRVFHAPSYYWGVRPQPAVNACASLQFCTLRITELGARLRAMSRVCVVLALCNSADLRIIRRANCRSRPGAVAGVCLLRRNPMTKSRIVGRGIQ
jgi:hypothetical protein